MPKSLLHICLRSSAPYPARTHQHPAVRRAGTDNPSAGRRSDLDAVPVGVHLPLNMFCQDI